MTQENVALVRRLLECFIAGEVLWDALDEAVEIHDHDILDAGEYRGHAGVMRWVEDWGAGLPVVSFDLQELIDAGDLVAARLSRDHAGDRIRGRRGDGRGHELGQGTLAGAARSGRVRGSRSLGGGRAPR